MQLLLRKGSERRWAMVRSIRATLREDTLHGLITLLGNVSPNLQSFELEAPEGATDVPPLAINAFDIRVLNSGIHWDFQALRHIKLGRYTTRLPGFLHFLCNQARPVESLDVTLDNTSFTIPSIPSELYAGRCEFLTNFTVLTRLRLVLKGHGNNLEGDDTTTGEYLGDFLEASPEIKQLSILHTPMEDPPEKTAHDVNWSFRSLSEIEDLDWRTDWISLDLAMGNISDQPGLQKLTRLILSCRNWSVVVSPSSLK